MLILLNELEAESKRLRIIYIYILFSVTNHENIIGLLVKLFDSKNSGLKTFGKQCWFF